MPVKLAPLSGAFDLHFLRWSELGEAWSKQLPGDRVEKVVKIRPTWRKFGSRMEEPEISVHNFEE